VTRYLIFIICRVSCTASWCCGWCMVSWHVMFGVICCVLCVCCGYYVRGFSWHIICCFSRHI